MAEAAEVALCQWDHCGSQGWLKLVGKCRASLLRQALLFHYETASPKKEGAADSKVLNYHGELCWRVSLVPLDEACLQLIHRRSRLLVLPDS